MCKARNVARDFYQYKLALDHSKRDIQVYWLYGPTGTGKSVSAELTVLKLLENAGLSQENYYIKYGSIKWWPRYIGQAGLIWDEFRYSNVATEGGLSALLKIFDRNCVDVEIKGGNVLLKARFCVVTSPFNPIS